MLGRQMAKLPLSIYFITLNEEARIGRALRAVAGLADEIIVVDSGSRDRTTEIAARYGARVIHNPWRGFASQKAFAARQCRNNWVLDLDADEEVSPALRERLQTLFGNGASPAHAAFLMTWKDVLPGQTKPSRFANTNKIIRLYDRTRTAIADIDMSNDDRPKVQSGTIGRIREPVYHRSILNLDHLEQKYSQLTREQAQFNASRGKRISPLKFYCELPLKFVKYYLLKRFFLLGWYGFTLAIIMAYRNFMRLAKTREIEKMAALESREKVAHQEALERRNSQEKEC